ncbi:MAG TPA: HEAT repeat domain-containing protein [Candidatus Hydrogenedentes bacterium]|nr:HEAT repeat domain-containing protein [Candidatus Hydrogenedentota bacterium]HPG65887.1 HEAT repeat domain-containing protein [Candidatus Hydrogenedentota bacterium]
MRYVMFAAIALGCALSAVAQPTPADPEWIAIHDRAVGVLEKALSEETEWVRVHAAEGLLRHGYRDGIEAIFLPQVETAPPQHRIGVWRVLAQAQTEADSREPYVARIRNAFGDVDGPDRLHAVETLAKLGDTARSDELLRVAREGEGELQAYARWVAANSGPAEDEAAFVTCLDSPEDAVRGTVGYGFRFFKAIRPASLERLAQAVRDEPDEGPRRIYLVSALYVHAQGDTKAEAREALLKYLENGIKEERYEACAGLGRNGDPGDVPLLIAHLDDPETDVRISAADALLAIERANGKTH